MFSANHQKFIEMDELSNQKVPFFFMIDFLVDKVEIFKENELKENGLAVDFQSFSNAKKQEVLEKKTDFEIFS